MLASFLQQLSGKKSKYENICSKINCLNDIYGITCSLLPVTNINKNEDEPMKNLREVSIKIIFQMHLYFKKQ